jgi:hypothetical protein
MGTIIKCLRGAAGNHLGTTTKYLRRTTSGAAGYGMGTIINCLRGAAGNGLGTPIKYLRRTTSAAAGYGLGTTAKYLLSTVGIALGTPIKYLRRTTSAAAGNRPGHHGKVPSTHNERRRGPRPEPIPGNPDVPIHHKRPVFAFFFFEFTSVASCVFVGPDFLSLY